MFTWDQTNGFLRQAVPFVAGILVALGYLTTIQADQVIALVNQLVTQIAAIGGPIAALYGLYLSWKANSKKSILTSAANMPEVKEIKIAPVSAAVEDKKAASELVQSTPPQVKLSV